MPAPISDEVIEKADGVPLFIEEITRAVVESSALQHADALPRSHVRLAIPATVRDSLEARLDRLGSDRGLVQLAAMLGRTFQFELLHSLMHSTPALSLRPQLDRLVKAGLLFRAGTPPDETYGFKHALIQDAAYESLLKSTRQHRHRQIAHTLTTQFPESAAAQPELLARHCAGGGMPQAASDAWSRAAEAAIARSAYAEAIEAYRHAIAQLMTLPASTARDLREVELRTAVGVALIATRGFAAPEVLDNYQRAHLLAERAGDVPASVLYGIWSVRLLTADIEATARLARQFEHLARSTEQFEERQLAHVTRGILAFFAGDYGRAGEAFRAANEMTDFSDPHALLNRLQAQGYEGVFYSLPYAAWTDTRAGELERAERVANESLVLAEKLGHPYTIAMVLSFVAARAYDLEDVAAIRRFCTRQRDLAAENGLAFWLATATTLLGWADVRDGLHAEGIAQIEQGLEMLKAIGCSLVCPYYASCAADAHLISGQPGTALAVVEEAIAMTHGRLATDYLPMLDKLKADILVALGKGADAEALYMRALATTREQGAKLFELRIAIAYAKALSAQARDVDAREVLTRSMPFAGGASQLAQAERLLESFTRPS